MRARVSRLTAVVAAAAGLALAGTAIAAGAATGDQAAPAQQAGAAQQAGSATTTQLAKVSRGTAWTEGPRVPLHFASFHPQGMVRVGDHYFMSAVQVLQPTTPCNPSCGGYDRTPGAGIGHVFEYDARGTLVHDLQLRQGDMYHAGGLDYDGRFLYVPLAEYRPHSHATIYRIDPTNWSTTVVAKVNDHIGTAAVDPVRHQLIGGNWGSRQFYTWNAKGQLLRTANNPAQFVDYQDCHHLPQDKMVCGGVAEFPINGTKTELGGLALLDITDLSLINTVPFTATSPGGHVGTRNPIWVQPIGNRLELQAVADDDNSTLQTWDTPPLG